MNLNVLNKAIGGGKIDEVDILKGIGICLVLVAHSAGGFVHTFAYSFHMPLFIFVSGWLFYYTRLSDAASAKWPYKAMLKEKIIRFGIPFIVFTLFGIILKSVFSTYMDRPTEISFHELANAFIYPYNGPLRELWFIATIMWMFALAPVWRLFLDNKWLNSLCLILLSVLYFFPLKTEFLALDHVTHLAVFFYGGLLVSKYELVSKTIAKISNLKGICLILLFFILYLCAMLFELHFCATWMAIILSIFLSVLLERFAPESFSSFRNYTFQIYLIGIWVQVAVRILVIKYEMPWLIGYLISICSGIYIPVLISKLFEKIDYKPLLLFVGLRPARK